MSNFVRVLMLASLVAPVGVRADNSDDQFYREPAAVAPTVESALAILTDPTDAYPRPPETDSTLQPSEILKLSLKVEAEKKNRSPASNVNDSKWSPFMHKMRDRFLNHLKTGADVARELDLLDAAFEGKGTYHGLTLAANDDDAREFIARIMPLRSLGGIVWKMIPIVEQTRMTQEVAVGVLRGMFEQMDIRFPDDQNKAVWEFFTQPYVGSKNPLDLHQFRYEDAKGNQVREKDDAEILLARGIATVYYPALQKAIERIEKIEIDPKNPIVLDNRMRWGDLSFDESTEGRFTAFGETERLASLARMNRRMFRIAFSLAYDPTGFVRYRKELGQAIGLDAIGIGPQRATGLTRRKQVAIANDTGAYPRLFNLIGGEREESLFTKEAYAQRKGVGAQWMWVAYNHMVKYALYSHTAWCSIKDDIAAGRDRSNILDPDLFTGRKDEIREAVHNMTGIVLGDAIVGKGLPCVSSSSSAAVKARVDKLTKEVAQAQTSKYTAHSRITGDVVTVNYRYFFMQPPESLRELLPKFPDNQKDPPNDSKVSVVVERTLRNGEKQQVKTFYRDYSLGRATQWHTVRYNKLFPDLSRGSDVDRMYSTLLHTRGGRIATQPFALFVR